MKPLVIYHDNCADGFGAAYAAWVELGDKAEYLPRQYHDKTPLPDVTGRDVYILDFSFSRDVMDDIIRRATKLVWLDHHKTSFEKWGLSNDQYYSYNDEHTRIVLDNSRSGAILAWEYFHPVVTVPALLQDIDDYDRWQFKLPTTKEVIKGLWSYTPWSFDQWRNIRARNLVQEGGAILRAHNQNVRSIVKDGARTCCITTNDSIPLHGYTLRGLAANCPPHLTSDVGHELADQSSTFGLCWVLSKEGLIAKCSLRSNGDYDVSVIAKEFGGGGHKNAAGFETSISALLSWLR